MRTYISGPMSGVINDNREMFFRASAMLKDRNHEVVSPPHNINPQTIEKYGTPTYEQYMREDIRFLLDCDAIAFLPGWDRSNGAYYEFMVAKCLGLENLWVIEVDGILKLTKDLT